MAESLSPEAQRVIGKARNWTFDDDNTLLQWMQQISQNIEQRATQTTQLFKQLNVSVKRTETALENVSNSLTALQYTQFVESRVRDDDDEETKPIKRTDATTSATAATEQTSQEMLQTFLQNNLKVLHKYYEKYAVDFDDSDDENSNNNCIYQAKNPYNDGVLPHIYGTKLWKENWHVGLKDGDNEYSGEESDVYSESSNSSVDNASADNSVNMSSNASLSTEKYPTNPIQSAVSLHGSQSVFPSARIKTSHSTQIAAGSDDSSPAHSQHTNKPFTGHDLFAPIQDTPPSMSTSSAMESAENQPSSKSSSYSSEHMHRERIEQIVTASKAPSPPPVQPHVSANKTVPIKRKPVNLFDDDDFNSFMSEIVDKQQAKPKASYVSQEPEPDVEPVVAAPIAAPRRVVNIFDGADEVQPNRSVPKPMPTSKQQPIEVPRTKKTVNLFDSSPESSPPKPTTATTTSALQFASKPLQSEISSKQDNAPNTYTASKSLFDDDDDDVDDFLNMFGKKKTSTQSQSFPKTVLFDDDLDDNGKPFTTAKHETAKGRTSTTNTISLFSDECESDGNEDNIFSISKNTKHSAPNTAALQENSSSAKANIFTDSKVDNLHISQADNKHASKHTENVAKPTKDVISKKLNLFDDNESDEEGDLFSTKRANSRPSMPKTESVISQTTDDFSKSTEKSNLFDAHAITTVQEIETKASDKARESSEHVIKSSSKLSEEEVNVLHQNVEHDLEKNTFADDESAKPEAVDRTTNLRASTSYLFDQATGATNATSDLQVDSSALDIKDESNDATAIANATSITSTPDFADREIVAVEDSGIEAYDSVSAPHTPDESANDNDNINITSTHEITSNATVPPLSNYVNIFSDEPPEDDDFFQSLGSSSVLRDQKPTTTRNESLDDVHVFDEPALPQLPHQDKGERPAGSSDYSGLRLFSDIPPDDDLDDTNDDDVSVYGISKSMPQANRNSNSLQHVFYDDFNETMQAIQQTDANKMPTHSLFSDEPPPDHGDFIETSIKKRLADKIVESTIIEANDTNNKRLGQSLVEDETDKVYVTRTAPIMNDKSQNVQTETVRPKGVSKLPKVNINVHALLPNAAGGRPNFKKSTSMEDRQHTTKAADSVPPQRTTLISTHSADAKQQSNENLLTSLCKNRVRVPTRRPSSRKGRQENYRKSLLIDNDYQLPEDQIATIVSAEATSAAPIIEPPIRVEQPVMEVPNKVDVRVQAETKNKLDFGNIFAEDDDNFLSDFQPTTNKLIIANTNTNTSVTLPNDERFVPEANRTEKSSVDVDKSNTKPFVTEQSVSEMQTKSMDTSSSELEYATSDPKIESVAKSKDDLNPIAKTAKTDAFNNDIGSNPVIATVKPSVSAANQLFADSDDSDGELFGNKPKSTTKSTQRNVKDAAAIPNDISNDGNKTSFTANKSESDSDDIFKGAPSKGGTAPHAAPALVSERGSNNKPTLLFASDNEDNDDFLTTLKSVKSEKQKMAPVESSKSLFSDDDSNDDDDLFGVAKVKSTKSAVHRDTKSSTAKTKSVGKSGSSAPKAERDAKRSTTIADNPLADLL